MTIVIPGVVSFGLALALVLAVFAWIAHNPANAERIALWFWSGTRWVSKTAETKALQRDVTHGINDFAVRIQDELEGYRPRGIDLAFIGSDESPNSFLDRGRLVVRIRPRTGRDQNFLAVASLYVAHTVFPIVKHHLRKNQ
ncbi:MAG TPA: hypothetical protein VFC51_05995, partial [Chloroflexota bacterium]|nr:hypothetical protein [Chloroflexota bacterium]